MHLNAILEEMALKNGITYFGVGDLSLVREAVLEQGGEKIAAYPYSITLGIVLGRK